MPIHHPPSRRGGRTGSPRGELSPQATEGCALSPPSPEGGERAASGGRRGSPLRENLNPCRPEQACCRAQRICDLNDRRGRSYDSYAPKDLRTSWKRTDPSTAGSALRSGRRILDHPQRAAPAGAFRSMTERSEALSAEMILQFCILPSAFKETPAPPPYTRPGSSRAASPSQEAKSPAVPPPLPAPVSGAVVPRPFCHSGG